MRKLFVTAMIMLTVSGCCTQRTSHYHTTVESSGPFCPGPNNVITVGNNTQSGLELSRDGVFLAFMEPGDVYTIRLHSYRHAVETTVTAVSRQPAGMKQRVFYLHNTGVQGLSWQIQALTPQGH